MELETIKKQTETLALAEAIFPPALLFALFDLGVLKLLAEGAQTFEGIHQAVGGDADSLSAVLDGAVALRVLKKRDGRYSAPEHLVETLGRPGSPTYMGEWVAYLSAMAGPIFKLADVVRSGKPAIVYQEALDGNQDEASRAWSTLMASAMAVNAKSRGVEIVDRVDFSKAKTFLDVGAGPGMYSFAIAERFPHLAVTLLDLPGSLDVAAKHVAERGYEERVKLVTGDATKWVPDAPFDAVLISNMLHMLGTPTAKALIRHAYEHLVAPGGMLIIQGQLLNDERTSPRWPTLLNLMVRVSTTHGRNHSIAEAVDWLREAGFTDIEQPSFSAFNLNRIVIGRKRA